MPVRTLVTLALLTLFLVHGRPLDGQSASQGSATLQGSVRDRHGKPLASSVVYLQDKTGSQPLTAQTDSAGTYRFAAVPQGVYVLRAKLAGYRDATYESFVLGKNETRTVILILEPQTADKTSSPSAATEFFDEPSFTVAGVTDTTNLGGHGSNTSVRTNEALAKDTVSLGKGSHAGSFSASSLNQQERVLQQAVAREPANFDVNHKLGKLLVEEGKPKEALPYLERASKLNPSSYENGYQLTLAYVASADYQRAGTTVQMLLTMQPRQAQGNAELHHLLGNIEGKLGNPVQAVREYQLAAELNPSELNLFDWGSELLMHRAAEPAIEVFSKGNRLFPGSIRMLLGLGSAWYANGSYDQAVERFCQASDLNPADPTPYLFMGRLQTAQTIPSEKLVEKLDRFVRLQPENAQANYSYALILWKRRKGPEDGRTSAQVEALLQKATQLDPKLAVAHLQLGILYSERKDFRKAILAYQKTIEADPRLEEAHYRMAQIYKSAGENLKAKQELEIFDQLSRKRASEVEHERHEIQQFVYKLRDPASSVQPQQ
jgi:tetratricopeptide (TPR) repeat protein